MAKKVWVALFAAWAQLSVLAQPMEDRWVDSVFQALSPDERIGQLFMPRIRSLSADSIDTQLELIRQYHIGGIVITGGSPVRHVHALKILQKKSEVPLLIGWAPEKTEAWPTMDSLPTFPSPLALSAIQHEDWLVDYGRELAREMELLGIHVFFGPYSDTDQEAYPKSLRYFGTNKYRVTAKSWAIVRGLHEGHRLSVATHFGTATKKSIVPLDSGGIVRLDLPDTTHFYPYQQLMQKGVDGILTSSLPYLSIVGKQTVPISLSQLFIGDLLKKKLGFQGLVFTDVPALSETVAKPRGGETEALAVQIGNDILIAPRDLAATVRNLKKQMRRNPMLALRITESVKKVLRAKYRLTLTNTELSTDNLIARLNNPEAAILKRKLYCESITLVNNEERLVPIAPLENKRFALLSIGHEAESPLSRMMSKYVPFETIAVRTATDTAGLTQRLATYDHVIAAIYPLASSFFSAALPHLYKFRKNQRMVVVHLGDPSQLLYLQDFSTVLEGYTEEPIVQQLAVQMVFGGLAPGGELPIRVSEKLAEKTGYFSPTLDRFSYGLPEEVGMDGRILRQIESIARQAIDSGATPGCHVLIARKGKVIYDNSFGWLTYDNQTPVSDQTVYDLASVTKVSATLQAVTFLYEKGMIDLDKKASVYLPELRSSNKKDFTLRDILTHQAGLWPFLPFWAQTIKDSIQRPEYYSYGPSEAFPYPVAKNLFASASMKDSLWHWIVTAKVREKIPRTPYDYRYSDMGFYILQHLAEKLLNQPIEDFLEQNLYEPLGASSLGFLPLTRFDSARIAPTEDDRTFRQSLLRGFVHDQGAAMHGGIAGHAGLFGTANDLAKIGQLWLNGGHYGGQQFFRPTTIATFTSRQFAMSRRGLGWDKPTPSDWSGPTTLLASPQTFGHTGFTGTCIWVDPAFDLVFVFLSNRVHPDMTNNKLLNANIRPRIQEVIYRSIFGYCQYENPETK